MNSLSKSSQETSNENESADYFFHFTDERKHLESIMKNYFMPFYCMESIDYLNLTDSNIKGMAYPVVCFCDLPLSRHKYHRDKFGKYGIGMKKEWGIKNKLTSIIYSHPNSNTTKSLKILIDMACLIRKELPDEFIKFDSAVSPLMIHYKPYEGKLYFKEAKLFDKKMTRFYDEREWRYIPSDVYELNLNLTIEQYQNDNILEEENKKIQKYNKIRFELDDVEYLFLKDKAEIKPFLSQLMPRYSKEEITEIRKKIQPL